jgi:hypothetical protein
MLTRLKGVLDNAISKFAVKSRRQDTVSRGAEHCLFGKAFYSFVSMRFRRLIFCRTIDKSIKDRIMNSASDSDKHVSLVYHLIRREWRMRFRAG